MAQGLENNFSKIKYFLNQLISFPQVTHYAQGIPLSLSLKFCSGNPSRFVLFTCPKKSPTNPCPPQRKLPKG